MDKFERLMFVFKAWSAIQMAKIHNQESYMQPRLEFNPDGSGRLRKWLTTDAMEFEDVDEVLNYMERRLPATVEELLADTGTTK
jgi:hypothetical protein